MRTTLSIEDNLYEQLRTEAARRRRPFKEIVNETLRKGLAAELPPRGVYRVPVVDLGHPPRMNVDHGLRLAEELEDEEIQRKMSVKK